MKHATLYDFRDIDLMLRLARVGDNEGWAETNLVAEAVGMNENGGVKAMGIRLSWMRRYGFIEFDGERRMWRLSRSGERVTESHLKAAQKRTIEAVPDEALVDVMSHVTSRFMLGDPVIAQLLRREFLFGTQKR